MKRKICLQLLTFFMSCYVSSMAGDKIRIYFNRPVDNSVSTTTNAIYLNNCIADTFVAYINRAKYTIDIALYDYNQGSYANVATAINNAYTRGVNIRWIYDGSSSNTGLSALNSSIHTLGSPTTSAYGIMHNKFIIIDAASTDPNDAIVWTGSFNLSTEQLNTDVNNAVIIQDSALAHAYTDEFNLMWGGAGLTPNLSASKFGPYKSDLGRHDFTIEGKHIELYFSPSDGTNAHIQSAISSANTDLYFGMYTFTDNSDASMIASKYNSGVYVAGIDDSYSNSYSPYNTFIANLGANFKIYYSPGIFHSKYMIVDPSDPCSDPLVLTGSHNWTISANTKNDENTLIIHDDTTANMYYQSFHANFLALGGTLNNIPGCTNAVPLNSLAGETMMIHPNPSHGQLAISYTLPVPEKVNIVISDATGRVVTMMHTGMMYEQPGNHAYHVQINEAGIYFAQLITGHACTTQKIIITGN